MSPQRQRITAVAIFLPAVAALILLAASQGPILARVYTNLAALTIIHRGQAGLVDDYLARAARLDARLPGPPRLAAGRLYEKQDYAAVVAGLAGGCAGRSLDHFSLLWYGLAYHRLGQDHAALSCFQSPQFVPYLLELGSRALQAGNAPEAEDLYLLAAQVDERSRPAALALGQFYEGQERPLDAQQWYQKALDVAPADAFTLVRLGALLSQQMHDEVTAESYMRRALKADPAYIDSYVWLGHFASARGDLAEAVSWYRQASQIDPASTWAALYLGRSLCETGDYEQGIARLNGVLAQDPHDASAYLSLAQVCYWPRSLLAEAQAAFAGALRYTTDPVLLVQVHMGLGDVYAAQGNYVQAGAEYRQVLVIQPGNQRAQERLDNTVRQGGD